MKQLQLTEAEIRIRDADALLSERFPCLLVEDNEFAHQYKVRLVFGCECLQLDPASDAGEKDPDELLKMFVVFKAWC